MPDRRWDDETRERLQDIAQHYENFARRVSIILWSLLALVAAGAILFTILLNDASDADHRNHLLAERAASLAQEIQQNRVEQCKESDKRHDAAVNALNSLYAHEPVSERLAATILPSRQAIVIVVNTHASGATSKASTLGLIGAIAPRPNCSALIRPPKRTAKRAPRAKRPQQ